MRQQYTVRMNSNRILIAGGDSRCGTHVYIQSLNRLLHLRKIGVLLIHGGCGIATEARGWAESNGVDHIVYPLNERRHGHQARRKLNELVIEHGRPEGILMVTGGADWDHLLELASAAGIPVWQPYTKS